MESNESDTLKLMVDEAAPKETPAQRKQKEEDMETWMNESRRRATTNQTFVPHLPKKRN